MDQVHSSSLAESWLEWKGQKRQFRGFMIESYLADGRQNQPEAFVYHNWPCLGWENTVTLVDGAAHEKQTKTLCA